eukprot:9147948-Lingulodinium_polyedra.AAC.1
MSATRPLRELPLRRRRSAGVCRGSSLTRVGPSCPAQLPFLQLLHRLPPTTTSCAARPATPVVVNDAAALDAARGTPRAPISAPRA